jgi:hypothetical protein
VSGQCKIRSTQEKRTFSNFSNSTTLCRSFRISISFRFYYHLEAKVLAFQNSDSIVSWRCDTGIKIPAVWDSQRRSFTEPLYFWNRTFVDFFNFYLHGDGVQYTAFWGVCTLTFLGGDSFES